MSARQLPTADATGFRLLARLDDYEQSVENLEAVGLRGEVYARIKLQLSEMRVLCASLPRLSVPWVHLLISHAELVHVVFRSVKETQETGGARTRHDMAIRSLREQCLAQFTPSKRIH